MGAGDLWDDPNFQFKPGRLKVGSEGITGWVAHSGEPVLASDVSLDPHYVWMQGSLTRSELTVPITVKGKTIGVLDVQSQHLDAFALTDLELMQAIAHQAGIAIENARLFSQIERRAEQFRVLTEVSQHIISLASVDELLNRIAQLVKDAFGYVHVGIGLVTGDRVISKAEVGAFEEAYRKSSIPLGEGIWGRVAKEGIPLMSDKVSVETNHKYMHDVGIHSHLCVPLKIKDKVIGVMSAASDHAEAFDQSDENILQTLANQVSVAIENALLFAETQRLLEETEERNTELSIINSLQLGLASKLDMKGIYELAGEKLRRIFSANGIVIYSYDHDRRLVIDEYAYEKGKRYEIPPQKMTPLHDRIIRTGGTICIQENAKGFFEENKHTMPAGEMPRSCIIVPFKTQGRVAGMIGLEDIDREFAFSESDVRLTETLSNSMVVALESARLFAETQRLLKETEQRATQLAIISSVQQELATKLDTQSIYELIGDTFRTIFDAQVVMISAYDPQTNTVEHRYAIERGERVHSAGPCPPGGFRSQIIQTRQPFLLNTHVAEEAARLGQPTLPGTITPKSWLGVPILDGNQVTGILSVQNVYHENAFTDADVGLLQTFAASMSIALENARLYEQARQLAILEERQRLGRELHDSVTQSLYGISLYAQAATGRIGAGQIDQAVQHLDDIQNTAQESLADMRLLIYELRPPILDKEGLVSALQNRLSSVENRANIKSSIQSNLTSRLPPAVEEGLYQIAREALNNIIKHAHARNVLIRIQQEPRSMLMEVSDDGIGFDPENACREGCLGLVNMQERARSQGWQLGIESSPGNGTRIRVEVDRND